MAENSKGGRVSTEQREAMLNFMKANTSLATNKFGAVDGVQPKRRLLLELTTLLNSIASGGSKIPDKWLKSWQDWRSDTKSKSAKIKRHINGTGGGPACKLKLTPLEEDLLSLMVKVAVDGHSTDDPYLLQEQSVALGVQDVQGNILLAEVMKGVVDDNVSQQLPIFIMPGPCSSSTDSNLTWSPSRPSVTPTPSSTPSPLAPPQKRAGTFTGEPSENQEGTGEKILTIVEKQGREKSKRLDIEKERLLIEKRQLELHERQVALLEKKTEMEAKWLELEVIQTTAIERMVTAATQALTLYVEHLQGQSM